MACVPVHLGVLARAGSPDSQSLHMLAMRYMEDCRRGGPVLPVISPPSCLLTVLNWRCRNGQSEHNQQEWRPGASNQGCIRAGWRDGSSSTSLNQRGWGAGGCGGRGRRGDSGPLRCGRLFRLSLVSVGTCPPSCHNSAASAAEVRCGVLSHTGPGSVQHGSRTALRRSGPIQSSAAPDPGDTAAPPSRPSPTHGTIRLPGETETVKPHVLAHCGHYRLGTASPGRTGLQVLLRHRG